MNCFTGKEIGKINGVPVHVMSGHGFSDEMIFMTDKAFKKIWPILELHLIKNEDKKIPE